MARTPSPANVALGRAVREIRLSRGISQEQLALESGLQRKTIYQLEVAASDPRYGTLRRVAEVLDVRVVDLVVVADALEDSPGARGTRSA